MMVETMVDVISSSTAESTLHRPRGSNDSFQLLKVEETVNTPGNYSPREVSTPTNTVASLSRDSKETPLREGRSELIRKHTKHINDLKTYYNGELSRLNEKITSLEQCTPSATGVTLQQHKQAERTIQHLQEQLVETQSQLASHVSQLGVANKMISVLQEQLVVSRNEQRVMKDEFLKVKEENAILCDSLRSAQQELEDNKTSQLEKMEQLLSELELTQQEYHRIKEQHDKVAEESVTVHHDQANLSAALAKMEYQRREDQSTIRSLEEELRRLQLTSNRTFNMSTHHSLATSFNSPVTVRTSPRFSSPVTVKTSPQYRPVSSISDPPSPPIRVPLTRRKWLEQSDASLISGVRSHDFGLHDQTRSRDHTELHDHTESHDHRSLEDTLTAVRTGGVTSYTNQQKTLEERALANLEEVGRAKEEFARLQEQKKQLESMLLRIPTTGRVTMEMKQKRLHTEEQLDHVIKELGAVRMLLRSHHALKSTT